MKTLLAWFKRPNLQTLVSNKIKQEELNLFHAAEQVEYWKHAQLLANCKLKRLKSLQSKLEQSIKHTLEKQNAN